MKIKKIKVYEFDELSDESKKKAVENLSDCNVDYEWWESIYEDADRVSVEITGFDIDHGSLSFKVHDEDDTAQRIVKEHGKTCDTYKLAKKFLKDRAALVRKYSTAPSRDVVDEKYYHKFDIELDELNDGFTSDLREEYLSMLRKEYEYLTSEAQIIDHIKINNWTFTAEGKLEN